MLKLIALTVFLFASPSFGLIESLLQSQNDCYSGCRSNYVTNSDNIFACQSGCNYKLQDEDCVNQCRLISSDKQMQASCLVGCSMNQVNIHDRPHRIAVVRVHTSLNDDSTVEERIRPMASSIADKIKKFLTLAKYTHLSSSNDDSEQPLRQFVVLHGTKLESTKAQLHHYVNHLHGQWNELVHKQSKVATWFFVGLCILFSLMLWYMIVSLCRRRPTSQNISIRAQDLVFDSSYEKEKIQPNEYYYDATQSAPIKVKLTHI
ncbi:unnamed protein product [Adineta ricciae]|uniref:Uncharacterized protein n=1 Tax=Adineta ricciae TaxID=249248 RepID=A0A815VN49_ADIRI|nr:unnamed protein product [Adineta ricciae]